MKKTKHCSFCGCELSKDNYGYEGIGAFICYQCLDLYSEIAHIKEINVDYCNDSLINPKYLYDELSKKIIGQEEAKKILSVALYRHYLRCKQNIKLEKANILMLGPTGVGKTYLAKTIAKILDLPLAICDATTYTQAGYVGEDVECILLRLYQNAGYDLNKAEHGIVFLDEFDKLARKGENPSITRDVSGEGVQNSLLKIIEGSVINVPKTGGRKHPYDDYLKFDTSNVLFICAGAFTGINFYDKNQVGFLSKGLNHKIGYLKSLQKYGIIPELLGRLPVICPLKALSIDDLVMILNNPYSSLIDEYISILKINDVKLTFESEAIKEIATVAYHLHIGARALKKVLETLMLDYLFEIPSSKIKEITITKNDVIKTFNYLNYQSA